MRLQKLPLLLYVNPRIVLTITFKEYTLFYEICQNFQTWHKMQFNFAFSWFEWSQLSSTLLSLTHQRKIVLEVYNLSPWFRLSSGEYTVELSYSTEGLEAQGENFNCIGYSSGPLSSPPSPNPLGEKVRGPSSLTFSSNGFSEGGEERGEDARRLKLRKVPKVVHWLKGGVGVVTQSWQMCEVRSQCSDTDRLCSEIHQSNLDNGRVDQIRNISWVNSDWLTNK